MKDHCTVKEAKVGQIDKGVAGNWRDRPRSLRLPWGSRVLTFLVGMLAWPDLLSGKIITEEGVEQWKSGWGAGGC